MRPNNQGKTGPVNFKREMARRARLEKEEALRKLPLWKRPKRGRPRKIGLPLDRTRAAKTRRRLAIAARRTCRISGLIFESIRSDATLCSAMCPKRASRAPLEKQRSGDSLCHT